LTTSQIFDALAVQIDGQRAAETQLEIHWRLPDADEELTLTLSNGVLSHRPRAPTGRPDATVTIERSALNELLLGDATFAELVATDRLSIGGDASALGRLFGLLDPPDPAFAIVTP
jgi:alkyl sulfatase BDS1-like metallo-beta-lactamase superfamily hydrolase